MTHSYTILVYFYNVFVMYVNYGWETVCQVQEWAVPAYTLKPLYQFSISHTSQTSVCEVWLIENWYRLLRNLINARDRAQL